MKITILALLLAFTFNTAMSQCDIGTTGIAVVNATNTANVTNGCVGKVFNFKFTIANFGSSPSCVMAPGTVKASFTFPTLSGNVKPYVYSGPSTFVSGFFTWTYDPFFEQLNAINTTAIGFGQGDANILVKVTGNAGGTGNSILNIVPGPNTNNTNNDFASAQLIINPLPVVTWTNPLTTQCVGATSYLLTGGTPSGGVYSGDGVTGTNFNASVAGVGTHTITYTYTNGTGCTSTALNNIEVAELPLVSAGTYGTVCSNSPDVILTGSPIGGTWSGIGVTGNSFDPSVGTQTLTYTYSDVNGCSNSANTTINVNTAPTIITGSYGPVCIDAADITLTGSPIGGTWSGTGVSGNSFDPSVGTQTVSYEFTDGNGCTASGSTVINVNPLPVVSAGSYGPVCSNAGLVTLTGSPIGGTWSGTGTSGNSFDPSVGTQTLTYTYTDGNGCTASSQTTLTVNTAPVLSPGSYGPVCSNAGLVTLTGSPIGGTWSGTGTSGNSFDPSVGTQTLTYTYSDGNGCTASSQTTITVNAAPFVSAGSYGPVCINGADITLAGSPIGGTWSGNGVTGNSFDPSVGTQTLIYAYTDVNGCTNSATTEVIVNPLPVITPGTYGPVCIDGADIVLAGSPIGGTWSGAGTSGNSFDPSVGTQTLTYSYTDGNGCSNSATTTITVNPLPVITTGTYGPVCIDGADITLAGSPIGGIWSGNGVTGNSFDPSVGTQTLTYTYTDGNGCTNSATTEVIVNPLPVITPGTYGPVCIDGADITLAGSPIGGSWSGNGVTGNNFDPSVGTQTLIYAYTDVNGCTNSATTEVIVNPLPVITPGTYGPVCIDGADIVLAGSPAGGTWSGNGVTGNSFDPSVGTQTLTYTYTDGNGCTNSATTEVIVNPLPVITPGTYGPVCIDGADITLAGSPIGGTWSGIGVTGNSFDPSAGTQTLTYTYSNGNGCENSGTVTITVNPLPVVSFSSLAATYCSTDPAASLSGSPAGGAFTGPGISGNNFDPAVAGAGTHTVVYTYSDGNGCAASSSQQVDVMVCATTIAVNLKLYLQGYYLGSGSMQPVLNNHLVAGSLPNETDTVEIELHDPLTFALVDSKKAVLMTDGSVNTSFVQAVGSYFIAIKHRNTIQTWSADPVSLSVSTPLYDFSLAANKAFGDNMAEVESGVWALYTGDINQDEFIDIFDFSQYNDDNLAGINGEYVATDINGDGFVDIFDFQIYNDNNLAGIMSVHP